MKPGSAKICDWRSAKVVNQQMANSSLFYCFNRKSGQSIIGFGLVCCPSSAFAYQKKNRKALARPGDEQEKNPGRHVVVGAQRFLPEQKARVKKKFGGNVLNDYRAGIIYNLPFVLTKPSGLHFDGPTVHGIAPAAKLSFFLTALLVLRRKV